MLIIHDSKVVMDSMKMAQETDTLSQLARWLVYLHTNFGDDVRVEIRGDLIDPDPRVLKWKAFKKGGGSKPWQSGELRYHSQGWHFSSSLG